MTNKERFEEFYAAVYAMVMSGEKHPKIIASEGICTNLGMFGVAIDFPVMFAGFRSWSKFSGSFASPVPDGDVVEKWVGEAGQLRLDLLGHLLRDCPGYILESNYISKAEMNAQLATLKEMHNEPR